MKPFSQYDLVPVYYDGQDQDGEPAFYETRAEVRARKKAGDGCFQRNGRIYVLFTPLEDTLDDILSKSAGSEFRQAWHIKQSGPTGPIVWQLRPQPAPQ